MVERQRSAALLFVVFALSILASGSLAAPASPPPLVHSLEQNEEPIPAEWPEGSAAYDNLVSIRP